MDSGHEDPFQAPVDPFQALEDPYQAPVDPFQDLEGPFQVLEDPFQVQTLVARDVADPASLVPDPWVPS